MKLDTGFRLVESEYYSMVSSCLNETWPCCCTKSAGGSLTGSAQQSVCRSPSCSQRQPGLAGHTSAQAWPQDLLWTDAAPTSTRCGEGDVLESRCCRGGCGSAAGPAATPIRPEATPLLGQRTQRTGRLLEQPVCIRASARRYGLTPKASAAIGRLLAYRLRRSAVELAGAAE